MGIDTKELTSYKNAINSRNKKIEPGMLVVNQSLTSDRIELSGIPKGPVCVAKDVQIRRT
jgi:hypothetical protein